MPERLQLLTDRPYPPAADQRGASVRVDWPVELQQRMRDLARQHNATTFMVMQAAGAVLLSRISASSDVAVGFPIADVKILQSTDSWASSSIRWCCASMSPVTPPHLSY